MTIARFRASGLSLVELMVAMTIGLVLMLGLLRVFAASREAARMAEGLSRVQENGRFALDFLQRDLRMVGHLGCVNDQAHLLQAKSKKAAVPSTLPIPETDVSGGAGTYPQFDAAIGIKGFEAAGTAPGDAIAISAERPAAKWVGVGAVPAYIRNLNPAPVPGSDIVALRYFSPTAVPVHAIVGNGTEDRTIVVDKARWDSAMATDGYAADNLSVVGIGDCAQIATFQLTAAPNGAGRIRVAGGVGLNGALGASFPFQLGQSMLYRLESEVFYVGWPEGRDQPSLYRARFTAAPGSNLVTQIGGTGSEELVEGVENMQLLYGVDLVADTSKAPSGFISEQMTASGIGSNHLWSRVGLVQVALLSRSNERASSEQLENRTLLGMRMTPPADGRYRAVYESTIALRNRLFGN